MKLRPLGDHVIAKPVEEEEVKKGGVIIPDTAKEKPSKAKVIAVGPGKTLDNGQKKAIDVKAWIDTHPHHAELRAFLRI